MPPSKTKELNVCIKESRDFFKNVINDTIVSLNLCQHLDSTEKASLKQIQAKWKKKYKPKKRLPAMPPPVPKQRTQNHLRSVAFLPDLPKMAQPVKKPRRSTIAGSGVRLPKHQENQHKTQREQQLAIEEVDDDELINMEIAVPKLMPDWPCRILSIKVPSRLPKNDMVARCLSWDFLAMLMELPEAQANQMLQEHVDEQTKTN